MNKDSRKAEIGELSQESLDWKVITWKIPSVSSILFAVDYGVQSPSFAFNGASWILKIYFNGQTKFNSKGYIDVIIERLHSHIQEQYFHCKIYCKNVFDKEFKPVNKYFAFHSKQTREHVLKIMENFHKRLDKWEIVPNDTFTLVCEIQSKKAIIETKSVEQTADENFIVTESTRLSEVGEIYKNSYQLESVTWKIHNASSLPSPEDYQVQSPPFSFASASWILKIYPYFQMQHARKQCFYVALQRLHSQISEHIIFVNICFDDYIKKAYDEVSRSCIFDSDHMIGDLICFTLREEQIKAPHDSFTLYCKFRTKRNIELKKSTNTVAKLVEPSAGYCESGSSVGLHKYKILQDLKDLFMKKEDCDVIIRVKGQEFPAHRPILKARSPIFDSTFRNDMKEKATGIVDIEDCDPTTFSDFLCFLYCGDIKILSAENVFSLFTTADKYNVQDLRSKCLEFMKENLTVDTFCDTIALALQHSEDQLIKLSIDYFTKNLQKIIVTVKWQLFLVQYPTQSNELFIKALVPDKSTNT